ncbi:unnamed protein product [Chironomus riparius]|uniref:Ras-associating domain-containing protein n=1 Tax=Chironomus riparius TaxID=315576 RepID=A0A9N9RJ13_9DIPT|nr:unnamed protein product [Chironomus riparius]
MLKHVHISPLRNRSDSISLRSSTSFSSANSSCATSLCGSPEPSSEYELKTSSRSSSYSSLSESVPQTTLKVYTACLKLDIEYKTLAVSWDTTARQIVTQVLRRCKMRHRDPRLFFLSMEVRIRRADARTLLTLDDSARPAMLQACHPSGESKFHLQMKAGGLIRVHTSALQQTSQYKSLLISEQTTSDELLSLLLSCYNSTEPVEDFSLYEVCPEQEYQRKLHPDDLPLRAQILRNQKGDACHFLVRRIRNMARRSVQLDIQNNNQKQNYSIDISSSLSPAMAQKIDEISIKSPSTSSIQSSSPSIVKSTFTKLESCFGKLNALTRYDQSSMPDVNGNVIQQQKQSQPRKCQCNMSSTQKCNYCSQRLMKGFNDSLMHSEPSLIKSPTYNPVYNIREIRTAQNSFSAFGNDKKMIDLDLSSRKAISRRHSVAVDEIEIVNSHPSRGIGNYVYI